LLVAGLISSQAVLAEARTIKDGVFTQAQVDAGKATYDTSCKTCHDMRFYRDALKSWDGQPVLWMWETILGTMPADNPGSLMLEEYTDVVAYILSENGFPAGETALDPDGNMSDISIVAP
jgi:mono/diheme cytochrome c family protein